MISLVIFAKVSRPGFAKTRIAASSGLEMADQIYRELLAVTAESVKGFDYHVAFTGQDHPAGLANYFSDAKSFYPQEGLILGDRLRNAFGHLFAQNTAGVIGIGCDCPYLTNKEYNKAIRFLEKNTDVVIGPATDGGYYLIGCQSHALSIFDARNWSHPELFEETIEIIQEKGYRYEILEEKSDIDTIDDYYLWKNNSKDELRSRIE